MAATLYPVTKLDYEQVIQHAYDESTQSLRSTAVATIAGDVTVEIDAADGDNIAIANEDGSKKVTVTTVGLSNALDVNVASGDVTATIIPQGLDNGVSHSRIAIGNVTPVELTSLLGDRNSVSFRVVDNVTVYLGDSTVTGESGANPGYPKFYREEIILDIKSTATTKIYAICETGQTSELAVLEI